MKRIKRVAFIFLFLFLVVTLGPSVAQAPQATSTTTATAPAAQPITLPQNTNSLSNNDILFGNVNPDVPRNISTISQNVLMQMLGSTTCLLSGRNPLDPTGKCLGIDASTGQLGYADTSSNNAATVMGNLIGGTFSIPVSSGGYTQYMAQNFGVTKTAYAQSSPMSYDAEGIGYKRLGALINIWTRFRDIAYLFFVLALTVIGLAIMFRVKIDARTVMSIQNQLPKVVIALILVTFSYAIAGFLIDMMYVLMFLIILAFDNITPTNINPDVNIFSVVNKAFSPGYNVPGIIGLTTTISFGISKALGVLAVDFLESTISSFFEIFFGPLNALSLGCQAVKFAGTGGLSALGYIPKFGDWLQGLPGVGNLFGAQGCDFVEMFFQAFFISLFMIVAFIVVLVAILVSLFRVWFTLIKSFAYILVDTIMGPMWIAAGIFPGSKLNFSTWVKHLMGHLSVFPMTFAVILLGKTIIDSLTNGGPMFSPPLVGDVIGGNTTLAAFVGFGFILSIPSILDRVRKAIGAMDFGLTDIKRSFGAGRALSGKGIGGAKEMAFGQKAEFAPGSAVPTAISGPTKFAKGFFGR